MPSDASATRLAAIMFTDIVGYSRMMEQDEERTIRVLKRHNEVVLPMVQAAGGEVIDAIGDGLFVLFPSVRDAVTAGTSIHDAVALANRDAPPGEEFTLRIGIHLGEVWREGERVFGNGVNIAARIQPFARPGGVCITEDVYRQIVSRPGYSLRSIGAKSLRNISRSIELYEVVTGHEADEESPGRSGASEFDTIKERLLAERERIAARHRDGGEDESVERRIESKVFGLVEHVMDRAMAKWESMPDEKKDRIIRKIEAGIEEGVGEADGEVDIVIGGRHIRSGAGGPGRGHAVVHGASDRKRPKGDDDGPRSVVSKLATGTVFGVGFGLGYFYLGIGWMVWPFALLGAFPFAIGVVKAIKLAAARRHERATRPRLVEQRILRIAGDLGGTVSVVQLARRADLPLDEVQAVLDQMTARGYVSQHVRESGLVEYEFPRLTEDA